MFVEKCNHIPPYTIEEDFWFTTKSFSGALQAINRYFNDDYDVFITQRNCTNENDRDMKIAKFFIDNFTNLHTGNINIFEGEVYFEVFEVE